MIDEEKRKEQDGAVPGRPGSRSVEALTEAVLALRAGKATVDLLAPAARSP